MKPDIACPTCRYDDLVQSVPAIRATGTSVEYSTQHDSGIAISSAGLIPVLGTSTTERTHSNALAASLALAPAQRTSAMLILFGVVLALPAIFGALAGITTYGDPDLVSTPSEIPGYAMAVLFFAAPSFLPFLIARSRIRRNSRISRGIPLARTVWQAGFYCHRCGCCFWPYQPAPGIPDRVPLSPNMFRQIVWATGGYA